MNTFIFKFIIVNSSQMNKSKEFLDNILLQKKYKNNTDK